MAASTNAGHGADSLQSDGLPMQKLLETMQTDLRNLCMQTKKRFPHIKESCEEAIMELSKRATSDSGQTSSTETLIQVSPHVVHPLIQACHTKDPKIVQFALSVLQKVVISGALVDTNLGGHVIEALWLLMEGGVEELRVLQTITLLVSTNRVVVGENLAKALVICLRLHFTKDLVIANTASATVRQMVSAVMERMVTSDDGNEGTVDSVCDAEELKTAKPSAPKTLGPAAADAFLMFQDLVQLVNADQPLWLVGLVEMTRTFGLDLLENVLTSFPSIFYKHPEFEYILKERVCALVIQLFSPNIKYRAQYLSAASKGGGNSNPPVQTQDKPYFPITVRLLRLVSTLIHHYYPLLVTQSEIFLSFLVKFLESNERPEWQRCLALEVLHNLAAQPHLLYEFTKHYDCSHHSTNIFENIVNSLGSFVQTLFLAGGNVSSSSGSTSGVVSTTISTPTSGPGVVINSHSPAILAGLPVGAGITPKAAFCYRGVNLPLVTSLASLPKPVYLQMIDKLDPPIIPEGYCISLACICLIDITKSIQKLLLDKEDRHNKKETTEVNENTAPDTDVAERVTADAIDEINLKDDVEKEAKVEKVDNKKSSTNDFKKVPTYDDEEAVLKQLIKSSWCGLLAALSTLLEACTDEAATESILQSFQTLASVSGNLKLNTPRDAFITSLCKSCLPPHYTLTVLNAGASDNNKVQPFQASQSSVPNLNMNYDSETRHQVVAVGSALATSTTPSAAQQGPVMLTNKNLQVMRAVLSLAHCHGDVLGSAWHLVLTTLQHLVWVLGLKPTPGGSLKQSGRNNSDAVITTAVIADLPVLSSMLSRLFESSAQLDDTALHHLIDALCKLSAESMQVAYTNREPSLFAVAKLLETGLINLSRVETIWRPITNHLLEVCQHPHVQMREWGVEAVTYLVRTALTHSGLTHPQSSSPNEEKTTMTPLKDNQKLQCLLLSPLSELSACSHSDVRHKQLECLLTILHSTGEQMQHGWPTILTVIAAVNDNHNKHLVRLAFQCLQLVVTDFLPLMPWRCLPLTVASAAKFGSQIQELNISLTAIGLMWNISDYFYQNQERLRSSVINDGGPIFPAFPGLPNMPAFDKLWMCLFARLGDLCVDGRPAVRKSAGQTLFSTIAAHGSLLHNTTWQAVLWQVLFPLLDKVRQLSACASTDKVDEAGNILIHHSRNTHQKQWAETQVLTLSGCARVFSTKQHLLQILPDYPRAWALMLDFIHTAALARTNEVSLAALKSLQEMLQSTRLSVEEESDVKKSDKPKSGEDFANWNTAWKIWYSIGIEVTKPPPDSVTKSSEAYVPSQTFLTALLQTLPPLFSRIKQRVGVEELSGLSSVLTGSVQVPVAANNAPFVLPTASDSSMITPLQESVLIVLEIVIRHVSGVQKDLPAEDESIEVFSSESSAPHDGELVPPVFKLLLKLATFSYQSASYGKLQTKPYTPKGVSNANSSSLLSGNGFYEYLSSPYFTFSERCLSLAIRLYRVTAHWNGVIAGSVLNDIVQCCIPAFQLKYSCPSWRPFISGLLTVLDTGLPLARENPNHNEKFWHSLNTALDAFLFSKRIGRLRTTVYWLIDSQLINTGRFDSLQELYLILQETKSNNREVIQLALLCTPPINQSGEEAEADEAIDCRVVTILQEKVLPHPSTTPPHFLMDTMVLLNKGSIHSTPVSEIEGFILREQFAKTCFETLLQFSLFSSNDILQSKNNISYFSKHISDKDSLLNCSKKDCVTSKLAVTSLLHRFKDVLVKYVEDTAIAGSCPLPRHRLAEISFVLQAIATLLSSIRDAPENTVDAMTWQQIIGLYPHLVEAGGGGGASNPHLWRSLREVLLQYAPLLHPPKLKN